MKVPEIITMRSLKIGLEYAEYCALINTVIRETTITKGAWRPDKTWSGDVYVYQDANVKMSFRNSTYGNDHYLLEVHRSVWNDLPGSVNPFMINEGGPWNFVYHFQDGRQVLLFHLPGQWFNVLVQNYR